MDSSYKKLLKVMTLFGSVQGLSIVMNLVRAKFAAELLGPAGVGLNSIYNETREFIHSTTNIGMDQSGTREIARNSDTENLADSVTLTRSWITAARETGCLRIMWHLTSERHRFLKIILTETRISVRSRRIPLHFLSRGIKKYE